jgi:putative permease
MPNRIEFPFSLRFSLSLVSIVLIGYILFIAQHILLPMTFAALFALLLVTPCNFLERKGLSRGFAAMISLLTFLLSGVIILYLISAQLIKFKDELPALTNQLNAGLKSLEDWAEGRFHLGTEKFHQLMDSASAKTLSGASSILGSTMSTLSNTLVFLVLIPIYTFLFLLYRGLILTFFIRCFPEQHTGTVRHVLSRTRYVIRGYVTGIFLEMVIVAVLTCTGFFILGVKYALLLGVITAVLNIIPYLGVFMACILGMIVTYTTNDPQVVLGLAIVVILVHLVDSNYILLKVMGSKLQMNALATLVGVISGGAIWGVPGMFLAIPLMAILKLVFDAMDSVPPWGLLMGEDETAGHGKPRWKFSWRKP